MAGAAGNVVDAWRTIRHELVAYGGGLAEKPEIIALNKKGQKPEKLEDYAITKETQTNTNEGYGEADINKISD